MKTFTDNSGRSWSVAINVECIKRVKSLLDVNLLDAVDGKLLEQFISDPVLLCDVLLRNLQTEADDQKHLG